jgi:catechol 2,3-dioxygenase-like lactoylglutathione lyase family enzyme
MHVTHLFSGIPTSQLPVALHWYEQLLGRPPDRRPHEGEAVWQLAGSGLIYVVADAERAGAALLTLIVDDLDALLAALAGRGISPSPIETMSNGVRTMRISDPDGNSITFGQVPVG